MLTHLTITNLAIIENIDVTFKEGFTVLTGGTGAGKSLIIDSLSLLLGARASSELIRQGEEKATIKGAFQVHNPRLDGVLSNLNVPLLSGSLTVERVIGRNKNSIKLNGVSSTLADLLSISKYLADIHNQFDFQKILNDENYLEIIDGFSYELTETYKKDYSAALEEYKKRKAAYEELVAKKNKLDESRDFYEYQYSELKAADLKEGEEEEIANELSLLKNYDKIYSLCQDANSILHSDFMDKLYELDTILHKLSSFQERFKTPHEAVDDRYYELDDLFAGLKKELANLDYDPNRLNELEERDSDLNSLKRKYKKSLPELISYRDDLSRLVGKGSNLEEEIGEKKKAMEEAFLLAYQKGEDLSSVRKQIAHSIENELEQNLADLLLKAKFQISFNDPAATDGDKTLLESGIDVVNFLIETNVGEGLKNLDDTVSGGEASRIMLALKAIFIKANKVSTVIFDEIDTGISGEAAAMVAKKIYQISLSSQVLAITHLPQVASLSDHSLLISKSVEGGRTYTHIKELTLDEKIKEVAELISGGKITEKQLEYAKEMVMSKRS